MGDLGAESRGMVVPNDSWVRQRALCRAVSLLMRAKLVMYDAPPLPGHQPFNLGRESGPCPIGDVERRRKIVFVPYADSVSPPRGLAPPIKCSYQARTFFHKALEISLPS